VARSVVWSVEHVVEEAARRALVGRCQPRSRRTKRVTRWFRPASRCVEPSLAAEAASERDPGAPVPPRRQDVSRAV